MLPNTSRIAVYSGTFDPITLGHEDVARRAAGLFDELIIAVAIAHHKKTRFSLKERLAMAAEAAELSDGHMVRNVVLFSVLVYELVGPTLTKMALTAAGEIIPEGRTNARMANKPEFPVSLD